ncbi:putative cyclic nucleotide-gated cation channel beta-1-like [Scophthalmus maximus]|uniref:Putative cyclic nucleotide-gated cation channel beta-1-like n=1 Tax=Scophthalmus maximus TaxID=52904 RepID=A0A2U9CAR2_SCOMX|nr:putative cyclic nucleotide-gated cation channel beta-1-like [Scophthalmus maximus]
MEMVRKRAVREMKRKTENTTEDEEETGAEDDWVDEGDKERQKRLHIIPKEAAEDDGDGDEKTGSKPGSSDEDEFIEDDIENLLAPQEQTKRAEKDLKVDDKPKEACDHVDTFRAEQDHSTKTDHQSDSDEFDHFYD